MPQTKGQRHQARSLSSTKKNNTYTTRQNKRKNKAQRGNTGVGMTTTTARSISPPSLSVEKKQQNRGGMTDRDTTKDGEIVMLCWVSPVAIDRMVTSISVIVENKHSRRPWLVAMQQHVVVEQKDLEATGKGCSLGYIIW